MPPSPTQAEVVAMGIVPAMVVGILLSLRFYARRGKVSFGADDLLIILAYVALIGIEADLIAGTVIAGYGQNSPAETIAAAYANYAAIIAQTAKVEFGFGVLQPLAVGLAKLSVLLFYRRIFCGAIFNAISWFMIFVVTAWTIAGCLLQIFPCQQIWMRWDPPKDSVYYCISSETIILVFSSFDVLTDILILTQPIYWTWQLQMHQGRKILTCIVFLFGGIATVSSCTTLVLYANIYKGEGTNPNKLGHLTSIAYYGTLEICLCIIAACLPTLGPLFSDGWKQRVSTHFRNAFSSLSRPSLPASSFQESSDVSIISKNSA